MVPLVSTHIKGSVLTWPMGNTLDVQLNVMIFQEDFLRVNGFQF